MQFSTLLATAAALTSASAFSVYSNTIKFTAESDNENVNNKGLTSKHEGAAINFVFLGDNAETYDYDYKTDVISLTFKNSDNQDFKQFLSIETVGGFPTLQVAADGSDYTIWSVENGYLKGNGSDNFYAAKNTNDPYKYSEQDYQVGLFPEGSETSAFTDAVPIKIKAEVEGKRSVDHKE